MNERERLEKLTRVTLEAHDASERFCKQQLAALRQALQHQRQEPVGEVNRHGLDSHGRKWHGIHWYDANVDVPHGTKLYTEPPKREWVGLTDEEVRAAYCTISDKEWAIGGMEDATKFTQAIEAKLKEKNT